MLLGFVFVRQGFQSYARMLGPILLLLVLVVSLRAQEFNPEHVVLPITNFKFNGRNGAPFSLKFGTGFCLDRDCRFVGTNYHVAKMMGNHIRIKGVWSAQRYLDSGPEDGGAQDIGFVGGGTLKYALIHDLAIYEMRHPLKNFHGISFATDGIEKSAEADIYTYPLNVSPKRGLVHWHVKFSGETPEGLLTFTYTEGRVRGGSSGGIVVESRTRKIIGIVNGVTKGKDRIVLAVPVKELSDFVMGTQPYLQTNLFPKTLFISPLSADLYAPYIWPRTENFSQPMLEPIEVIKLRHAAQHLADSMRNFIATETLSWGHDNREPDLTDAYETSIIAGFQHWRHVGSQKFEDESPMPRMWLSSAITTGDLWIHLPEMVGTELNLKIHAAPDAVVNDKTLHVFQYDAQAKDGICGFQLFGNLGSERKFYDCHGEVWTDGSGTILRISESLDLSGPWYHFWGVMTYGWLNKDGRRYLVPVTFATQAENKRTYWCRGLFTDYQMFGVRALLVQPAGADQEKSYTLDRH